MAFLRISFKSCINAHTKHNIRPRCTKVKQRSNHGAIYLLIHRFSIFIKIEMSIHGHRCLDWFSIGHVKLLEHITCILGLTYESSFLQLLDLKTKEELQFTHHGHLKSLGHDPTKLFTKLFISRTKDNVININLTHEEIYIYFLSKESRIGFANYKS